MSSGTPLPLRDDVDVTAVSHNGRDLTHWWQTRKGLALWVPTLRVERSVMQGMRKVRDRDLLLSAALIIRKDLIGRGIGQVVKRAHDAWLGAHWSLARQLLS